MNLAETKLDYLEDTYRFEGTATVVDLAKDDRGSFVVLNKTIFYPQGGGQPSDVGQMIIDDVSYPVSFVSFNHGIVHHYINQVTLDSVLKGKNAFLEVDLQKRLIHAKAHTAGHLLGHIVERIAPELIAAKGYHFLNGPYVEFEGALVSCSKEDLLTKANSTLKQAIAAAHLLTAFEIEPELLNSFRLPSQFKVPTGKSTRAVHIQGFNPSPCGGTHIESLAELKEVTLKKIQVQANKNLTKISYIFE